MERTCVGCRLRSSRAELSRIVEESNFLVFDIQKKLPGRGAWIHPSQDCLNLAIQRNAFGRALKLNKQPDSSAITNEQAETMLAKNE
jgi:predicted RNA-binding protein YlxR (DUF448 family)